MPLDGEECQVDVLAVTERSARRHDLGQDGGELERGALSRVSPAQRAGFFAVIDALSEAQL